jgi:dTDP-4-dehydrorhamnose reductase
MVAPISLALLAEVAARILLETRATGIFQLSAADQLSYAEIARHIAKRVGAAPELVRPARAAHTLDPRTLWLPDSARLGSARLAAELGITPPAAIAVVDEFLRVKGAPP